MSTEINTDTSTALGAFGKKPATTTTKLYPKLADPDGHVARAVDKRRKLKVEFDQAKGELAQIDGALKDLTFDTWLARNEDRDTTDDTIQADGKSGSVKISVKSRYFDISLDPNDPKSVIRMDNIKKTLGASFDTYVTRKFKLDVDGAGIPPDAESEFLGEFAGLIEKHGGDPSTAVKAKEVLTLSPRFHTDRHSILNPSENKRFHGEWACPLSVR